MESIDWYAGVFEGIFNLLTPKKHSGLYHIKSKISSTDFQLIVKDDNCSEYHYTIN